jgi:uncharacterized membrane protein YfhO
MRTACAKPAILLRRELYFPGWRASVNGAPTPVTQAGIFEQIRLPAGPARIRFSYLPPGTARNCGLALVALLIWLACAMSARRRPQPKF